MAFNGWPELDLLEAQRTRKIAQKQRRGREHGPGFDAIAATSTTSAAAATPAATAAAATVIAGTATIICVVSKHRVEETVQPRPSTMGMSGEREGPERKCWWQSRPFLLLLLLPLLLLLLLMLLLQPTCHGK